MLDHGPSASELVSSAASCGHDDPGSRPGEPVPAAFAPASVAFLAAPSAFPAAPAGPGPLALPTTPPVADVPVPTPLAATPLAATAPIAAAIPIAAATAATTRGPDAAATPHARLARASRRRVTSPP